MWLLNQLISITLDIFSALDPNPFLEVYGIKKKFRLYKVKNDETNYNIFQLKRFIYPLFVKLVVCTSKGWYTARVTLMTKICFGTEYLILIKINRQRKLFLQNGKYKIISLSQDGGMKEKETQL